MHIGFWITPNGCSLGEVGRMVCKFFARYVGSKFELMVKHGLMGTHQQYQGLDLPDGWALLARGPLAWSLAPDSRLEA